MEENMRVHRTYKDRLFRLIFKEKGPLLELYNAMNGTTYNNAEELTVSTLENAIYMNMRNDVSFLLHDELTLYEQQSTYNPNMPLRNLFYAAKSYSVITRNENLYSTRLISLPSPRFVTFYNGRGDQPEKSILRLSDAYSSQTEHAELELEVRVININLNCNEKLLESCRPLKEYMIYVDKVRRYEAEGSLEGAVERAIEECIEEGVLEDFLRKNRAEVRSVSIFEYDEERHIQMEREEARADGLEEGMRKGIKEGIKEGIEKGICALIEFGETFDLPTEDILKGIQEKFSLTSEEAQDALKKYGKCMNYQA